MKRKVCKKGKLCNKKKYKEIKQRVEYKMKKELSRIRHSKREHYISIYIRTATANQLEYINIIWGLSRTHPVIVKQSLSLTSSGAKTFVFYTWQFYSAFYCGGGRFTTTEQFVSQKSFHCKFFSVALYCFLVLLLYLIYLCYSLFCLLTPCLTRSEQAHVRSVPHQGGAVRGR